MTGRPSDPSRERIRATPLARKVALEHGVALERIAGSGRAGRITRQDVAARADSGRVQPAARAALGVVREREAMETAATRTAPVPTAWMLVEVDLSGLEREAPAVATAGRPARRDAIVAHLPRAVARALRAFPLVNGAWAGNGIHLRPVIALAVEGAPHGKGRPLLLPDPDRLSLAEVGERLQRPGYADATSEQATFTVTLAGAATATVLAQQSIPPGQAACLVVGEPTRRLVAEGDALAMREIATLGILFDHRVMDGAPAARFLAAVREGWISGEGPAS